MRRVVVAGGSLAGVHAAEALRERGFEGELTLVSAERRVPYDRPPLSKEMLVGEMPVERLQLRPDSWYEELGIDLSLGRAARGLDAKEQRLLLEGGVELDYDGLVIATGTRARRPMVPTGDAKVHVVRTLEDSLNLRPELIPGRHVVIVGGGFIGLEVAGVARRLGLEVTLIEASSAPLARAFGPDVSSWYRNLHDRHGVRFACDCGLESIERTPGGVRVSLNNGTSIVGDLVVAGIGAVPAIDWLAGSGVELDDGVLCGPDLATSVPNIVAAGDLVNWKNPIFNLRMRVEHWSNAVDQGRHAAATLLGERDPFASVPYFWTDQHDTKMRFVGRARGATDSRVVLDSDGKFVVVFGRDGLLVGALCVGSPRHMAKYKVAIQNRALWNEIVEDLRTVPG